MDEPIVVFGAGSLRAALTDIAASFEASDGTPVTIEVGASGTLRKKIESGVTCHLFASANMEHPAMLCADGLGEVPQRFCGNRIVTLSRRDIKLGADSMLAVLLDPDIRVGTSTTGHDPSGDYADFLFERAESSDPGAGAALKAKALRLTGAPNSPRPSGGGNLYAWVLSSKRCDVFLTYVTNARRACAENADLAWVEPPPPLAVRADYGLCVLDRAPMAARRFRQYILATEGRAILNRHGFEADDPEQGEN